VLSDPKLTSTPDLSVHPHPELVAPDLEKALAHEEESVLELAENFCRS
jgi:hypothetical protein